MGAFGIAFGAAIALGLLAFLVIATRRGSRRRRLEDYQEILPLLHCMTVGAEDPEDPFFYLEAGPLGPAVRNKAARIIAGWTDRDIEDVSRFIAAAWLDGKASPADIAVFLKEERTLIGQIPGLVTLHIVRLARRFGGIGGTGARA